MFLFGGTLYFNPLGVNAYTFSISYFLNILFDGTSNANYPPIDYPITENFYQLSCSKIGGINENKVSI